jgi:hypothetical protein
VVAPDTRGINLSSKPEDFKDYGVDLLADANRGLTTRADQRVVMAQASEYFLAPVL